ncbi:MAG: helix-hairpin-helix domain-containing protein [Xanthomonadales bacterium]|nr:helix-hairpin-helix domain-containing protein [Xanthomonadales bacterium]
MKIKGLFIVLLLMGFLAVVQAQEKVDINTADAATLATALQGIGTQKAEAIVLYREQHGPFKTVDMLTQVKGIGPQTIEKNRDRIVVGAR